MERRAPPHLPIRGAAARCKPPRPRRSPRQPALRRREPLSARRVVRVRAAARDGDVGRLVGAVRERCGHAVWRERMCVGSRSAENEPTVSFDGTVRGTCASFVPTRRAALARSGRSGLGSGGGVRIGVRAIRLYGAREESLFRVVCVSGPRLGWRRISNFNNLGRLTPGTLAAATCAAVAAGRRAEGGAHTYDDSRGLRPHLYPHTPRRAPAWPQRVSTTHTLDRRIARPPHTGP